MCGFCLGSWCRKISDNQERVWWPTSGPAQPNRVNHDILVEWGVEGKEVVEDTEQRERVGGGWKGLHRKRWGGELRWKRESWSRKIMWLFAKGGKENEIKRAEEKKKHWWQQPDATYCYHQSQRRPIRSVCHSRLKQTEVLPCKWISFLKIIKSSIINQTDSSDWWFSRSAHTVLVWLVANRLRLVSPRVHTGCSPCQMHWGMVWVGGYGSKKGACGREWGVLN